MSAYAVIIEGSDGAYSGYVPDLPGCIATGASLDEVEALLRDAVVLHIEHLRAHDDPVPEPSTAAVRMVEVA